MDSTLVQLLNHIYDLEQEKAVLLDFFETNRTLLEANNTTVPGVAPKPQAPEQPEG